MIFAMNEMQSLKDSDTTSNPARRRYAEELKYVAHIRSDAIVRAFAKVPREKFLGPGPWRIVGGGGTGPPRMTIRNTYITAYLCQLIRRVA